MASAPSLSSVSFKKQALAEERGCHTTTKGRAQGDTSVWTSSTCVIVKGNLTTLGLIFLVCKMGVLILTSQVVLNIEGICKHTHSHP